MIAAPINYLEARWLDGYRNVSTATSALMVSCERLVATLPPTDDTVVLDVATVEPEPGQRSAVGLLRFDVVVSTGSRRLRYVHAVVLPDREALDPAAWRRLVERRYGDAPERAIRERYERAAVTEAVAGREVFADLEVDADDVRAVLGAAPAKKGAAPQPAGGVHGTPVAVVIGSGPPTTPPRPARPRPTRAWLLLALLVVAIASWVVGRRGRAPTRDAGADPDVAALRARVAELERDAGQQATVLDSLRGELDRCEAKLEQGAPGLAAQLDQANRDLSAARDQAAQADGLATRWKTEATKLQESLQGVRDSNAALQDRVTEKDNAVKLAKEQLATVCKKFRTGRPAECPPP